jgi:hypothetical protein
MNRVYFDYVHFDRVYDDVYIMNIYIIIGHRLRLLISLIVLFLSFFIGTICVIFNSSGITQ